MYNCTIMPFCSLPCTAWNLIMQKFMTTAQLHFTLVGVFACCFHFFASVFLCSQCYRPLERGTLLYALEKINIAYWSPLWVCLSTLCICQRLGSRQRQTPKTMERAALVMLRSLVHSCRRWHKRHR
jgi:hypothetical protein